MDIEHYRKVINDAIKGEIEARKFYEEVSSRIKKDSLKELFKNFAQEEAKHEAILKGVLKNEKLEKRYFDFNKDFKVAETIEMPEVSPEMDLKNAVGIAMKNEEIAMKKYAALAENCEDEELKSVFQDLASMEREHKFKMEKSFVDVAYPEIW